LKKARKVSRAALRREAKERAELFLAIGEFIFEFSQLEFTIRVALATLLNPAWNDDKFDAVTSPYDFAALCRVTWEVCKGDPRILPTLADQADKEAEVARVFKACLAINDERVRIAHGTWTIGSGARHVARGTLKAQFHFEKPEKIVEKTREVKKLMASVVQLLGWEPAKAAGA
jgi:hypothetical protein